MQALPKHPKILGLAVALIVTACADDGRSSTPASTATSPADATVVAEITTATAGSAYGTQAFKVPFDVILPDWLDATSSEEQPNFVTWQSPSVDRAVRVLIPVNVYPPGDSGPSAPPPDYLHYLLAQTAHGAHFADQTQTTVGGKPATIVTATVDDSLDGSLGCPDAVTPAGDCFGLQPDLVLRIAVVETGAEPLLIWLRGPAGTDMTADNAAFAELLTTIRFSDRPVQAPVTTTTIAGVATALDGTYRWTLTAADAVAHGTPDDKTPEGLATFPWMFTMTMDAGTWQLANIDGRGVPNTDAGHGSYTVDGADVVFHEAAEVFDYAFSVDPDGTVHLVAQPPINPGTAWVFATEPWTKIS